MKKLLLILYVLTLIACTASPPAKEIKPVTEDNVRFCDHLGTVNATGIGQTSAKNQCLNKAAKMGATHIVWAMVKGGWSASATGDAYRCY